MSTEQEVGLQQAYENAIRRGSRVDAIKYYRQINNCGFNEAFDYIQENWLKIRREYCK